MFDACRWRGSSAGALVLLLATTTASRAFDDKDCGRVETVQQTYSLDLKSADSVESARTRATTEIVKRAIAQVIGYEVHSDREQNTRITNNDAQQQYQDAEKALLDGLARVKVLDEKRTALPDGQTLSLSAEVKVCVPKPEAVRKAEEERDERLLNPPKPVDPFKAVWFNPASGQPQIWYVKEEDGSFVFFDNAGYDPQSGEQLHPISPKVLREWRASLARRKREELAQIEAAKNAAEQKALADERAKVEAQRRADLVSHARENCDKLAANPNDPDKPKLISAATYDELKGSVGAAIEACEAAISIEPTDLRLRYQLARAYSVNDPIRAAPIFRALCQQHYRAAYDNYGWTFLDRRVGENNLAAAIAFFRKGAQLGDTDAMVSLASYMQRGKVAGASYNDAIALYQRAAAIGNQDAEKALEPLLAAQKQAEQQHQQELQNAQAIMGLFGGMVGGMRR